MLIQGSLIAQHPVWPQPGAEWEICHSQPWGGDSYSITPSIRYEKDTIINSTEYQITSRQTANGQIMIEFYTRFNQDTIFRNVNGNEYMFFTYNVVVGDTLFPLRTGIDDYNEDTCSYSLELLCLDIYPISIDGNMLNLYEFVDVGNSIFGLNGPSGQTTKYYWVEVIGWVSRFPWLIEPSEETCNEIIFDDGLEFPIYYTDSTRSWAIEFQENDLVCDTLLSVEENFLNISLYPNPARKGKPIYFKGLPSNSRIEIINTLGEIQRFDLINSNQIIMTNINDGVYFIKLFDDSNQLFKTVKLLIF